MALSERVRQLVAGGAEGDDERQVEEQLERGRDAMVFVGIATAHAEQSVRAAGHGQGAACLIGRFSVIESTGSSSPSSLGRIKSCSGNCLLRSVQTDTSA